MKRAVVSYSLTGNNEALAQGIAAALGATHIRLTEEKPRTNGIIAADMIFGRTPKVSPGPETMAAYERVVLVAPVWMGQPASPLRGYLKYLKAHPLKCAFVSISGGSLNPNPGLKKAVEKRLGRPLNAFADFHITDLLPKDVKPEPAAIEAYKFTADDLDKLVAGALAALRVL